MFASGSLATNVPLYSKLPFHPIKDFVPIGIVGQSFYVLLVQPSLGVNSVQELITMAKAKPGYGHSLSFMQLAKPDADVPSERTKRP